MCHLSIMKGNVVLLHFIFNCIGISSIIFCHENHYYVKTFTTVMGRYESLSVLAIMTLFAVWRQLWPFENSSYNDFH